MRQLGLRTVLVLAMAVAMLVPAFLAGTYFIGRLQSAADTVLANTLRERGQLAAGQFARRLHVLWNDVVRLGAELDRASPEEMRTKIGLLQKLDPRYSWVGAADVNGRVMAASGGLLEGQDVSARPWFVQGLEGPLAGDVHEAKLLAGLLPPAPTPYRFIDFAVPLRDWRDATRGVLGAHIDWTWVESTLRSLEGNGAEILLLSRDREVLFGPQAFVGTKLSIGSAVAAGQSVSVARNETWPDGEFFTVVVPTVAHEDLPSFGWSIIVRQNLNAAMGPIRQTTQLFWQLFVITAAVVLVLIWLVGAWIATPLGRLAGFADKLAAGSADQAPHEESRYREATRLCGALVRLQSRLASGRVGPE